MKVVIKKDGLDTIREVSTVFFTGDTIIEISKAAIIGTKYTNENDLKTLINNNIITKDVSVEVKI